MFLEREEAFLRPIVAYLLPAYQDQDIVFCEKRYNFNILLYLLSSERPKNLRLPDVTFNEL
jgi:hypothetical protein